LLLSIVERILVPRKLLRIYQKYINLESSPIQLIDVFKKKVKTILETTLDKVPTFKIVAVKLEKSFVVNGKSSSTLSNYLRCLAHLTIYYKCSTEELSETQINNYLYPCKNLHKPPSESFFKHTVFGLRAVYKVLGLKEKGQKKINSETPN